MSIIIANAETRPLESLQLTSRIVFKRGTDEDFSDLIDYMRFIQRLTFPPAPCIKFSISPSVAAELSPGAVMAKTA